MQKFMTVLLTGVLAFSSLTMCAQTDKSKRPSPPAQATATLASGATITIDYSQPSVKGRTVGQNLEPKQGEVWRTGANNATEITFTADTKFGGQAIKAGTYSLFTIPGEKEWTIILNSELKQWGSFGYEKIKAKDVLKVTATPVKIKEVVEQFTIRFDSSNNLILEWDTTQVSVKVG